METLIGKRIGKLRILKIKEGTKKTYLCICDCGSEVVLLYSELFTKKGKGKGRKSCGCLRAKRDLENQVVGKLTVLYKASNYGKNYKYRWICKCECGNIIDVAETYLKNKTKTHCGCYITGNAKDLRNQKFNRLLVVDMIGRDKYKKVLWDCKCDCGNHKIVSGYDLLRNGVKSCGCLFEDSRVEIGQQLRCWHQKEENKKIYLNSLKRGKEHHGYNSSLTDKDRQDRKYAKRTIEYNIWRKEVLKRDGCICQKCHSSNSSMSVHHIYPWRLYEKERFNVNNGITFCMKCHHEYHSIYGKNINCNISSLYLFLNEDCNIQTMP